MAGLGDKLGVLVLQLSPLPRRWLADPEALHQRLERLLAAIAAALPAGALCAVEVRDPELLTPAFARLLQAHGTRYCLGLHDRTPPIAEQLPMLRAQWPGALVCRWNLQRGLAYDQARNLFQPFDKLAAPDPATRQALARVMVATAQTGHPVFVAPGPSAGPLPSRPGSPRGIVRCTHWTRGRHSTTRPRAAPRCR